MKRMIAAGVLMVAGSAGAELRLYEPVTPLAWHSWEVFHPNSTTGLVGSGVHQFTTQPAEGNTPVQRHFFDCNLLMAIMTDTVPNVMSININGTEYTSSGGDFSVIVLREFSPGDSVGGPVTAPSGASFGWSNGSGPISRTYRVRDAGAPGGSRFALLPGDLHAGFTSFDLNTGQMHFGWAELEWVPVAPASQSYWRIWRWGYETTPGVPARIPPISGCPSDFNGDRDTNAADLSILLAQFGTNVTPGTGADSNGNGVVDTGDLSAMLAWFGCNEIVVN